MINIGTTQLATTAAPADLDAQLEASVYCSPAEAVRMLGGLPLADFVAKTLKPFLTAMAPVDLAQQIQAAGVAPIAQAVLALYTAASVTPEPLPAGIDDPGAPGSDEDAPQ